MPGTFYVDCGGAARFFLLLRQAPYLLSHLPGPIILLNLTIESSSPNTVPNMKQACKEWGGVG